ncbi:ribosomal protein S8 [Xylariomycetidae sp. FL0641]|nr:ribosomal protein S8 [Xylariomycetidae sp. FL0641]
MGISGMCSAISHLQNASRARLGLTSIPHTKYSLALVLALHRCGFLSFVVRGDRNPPDPAALSEHTPPPLTTATQAKARLWLGLKYSDGKPVMGHVSTVSTPKRWQTANLRELERLTRGFDTARQRGLNLGECLIVGTDRGLLESREAIERKVGGSLLCRVGP